MWTENFQMFKLHLEKAEEPEIKLSTSIGCRKSKRISERVRHDSSASLTMLKPLIMWITTNCGKLLKKSEYQTTLPASWEICMQVKKQQLEPEMEQRTGSNLGEEYVKAVYCPPAYLSYMQRTSCEILGCMEFILPGEISKPQTGRWHHPYWTSLVAQTVKHLPTMWETWVQSLGREDLLEKEMATHSSILPGKSHGWRSLVGYSPWGHQELDMTERLHFHFSLSAESEEELKILMKVKEESEKAGLKLNIQNKNIMLSGPITWR